MIMISLELAQALKEAGLVWRADLHHFFAIPERGFDDRVFVISDLMAHLDLLKGWPIVAFHGAVEWALDYILTTEVVWMPTEEQLRQELEEILLGEPEVVLQLGWQPHGYTCDIRFRGESLSFSAKSASDAYGLALWHILQAVS
ncbi:MAG: hypothetical protein H6658_10030 [Ardenticatenaceae bacterium]|nr:hypothetical protein [Ardenticatenaceae bacterium]